MNVYDWMALQNSAPKYSRDDSPIYAAVRADGALDVRIAHPHDYVHNVVHHKDLILFARWVLETFGSEPPT